MMIHTVRLGIDPGVNGALCMLHDPECIEFFEMPTLTGGTGRQYVDPYALIELLVSLTKYSPVVVVEKLHYRPGLPGFAAFPMGDAFGVLRCALAAVQLKTFYVEPVIWKRVAGLIKKPKDYSRTVAIQEFPHLRKELARKKDVDKAEALLIAVYGLKETYSGRKRRRVKTIKKRKRLPQRGR